MIQPAVVEQVLRFGNSNRVAEHLLRASQTDLSDPEARQAFEEHAPAVVQKLALLDSERADFVSFSTKMVEIDEESTLEVGFSLNSCGRVAALILKDVSGARSKMCSESRVTELVGKIREDTRVAFGRIEGPAGPTSSGPPEIPLHQGRCRLDRLRALQAVDRVHLRWQLRGGSLGLPGTRQLRWNRAERGSGDAQVSGTFSFVATWYFSADPGGVDEGECWIKSWKDDIQSHNLRTA